MIERVVLLTFILVCLALVGLFYLFRPFGERIQRYLRAQDAAEDERLRDQLHLEQMREEAEKELDSDINIGGKHAH